jgi:hypothetical protein
VLVASTRNCAERSATGVSTDTGCGAIGKLTEVAPDGTVTEKSGVWPAAPATMATKVTIVPIVVLIAAE